VYVIIENIRELLEGKRTIVSNRIKGELL